jgi:hypothetical protein
LKDHKNTGYVDSFRILTAFVGTLALTTARFWVTRNGVNRRLHMASRRQIPRPYQRPGNRRNLVFLVNSL